MIPNIISRDLFNPEEFEKVHDPKGKNEEDQLPIFDFKVYDG